MMTYHNNKELISSAFFSEGMKNSLRYADFLTSRTMQRDCFCNFGLIEIELARISSAEIDFGYTVDKQQNSKYRASANIVFRLRK